MAKGRQAVSVCYEKGKGHLMGTGKRGKEPFCAVSLGFQTKRLRPREKGHAQGNSENKAQN